MSPTRTPWAALALLVAASPAPADGLSPADAVKAMKLPAGFTVSAVATEPMIRQPLSISFDDRGRMWVLQYLQYPNYAGLKPVKQDQYLRTVWDKVPEPPPHGPKGLDRITILSDPDANGVFTKSKDFVTGLNIASGFCLGNGGVYVAQPPYLLFYPDKNADDVPDADPEVLLTGFGMDDTHSLANSLQWGPDGWLYGAAGSTSTSRIKNPAGSDVVEFQQGIWRYHPKTKRFELFSEGGGNTYGLDFDRHGQVIAGTNYGGFAMLHQMQGAYHVKGFGKHGPLHNPHTYGYFNHVPYTGFKGGHVTCGGIVYQADAYPPEFRDQYIAGNLLSNALYWHKMERDGSTFKAKHGGELMETPDTWFRPVDLLQGPDGCVYVVDWYDRRAAHLDPVDNWDKTNGRVYRIAYKNTPHTPPFDLRKKTGAELVELLKHPNKWWRNEARRLLAERQDTSVSGTLAKMVEANDGHSLEAFWTLAQLGGLKDRAAVETACAHPSPHVREWAVRLVGDAARDYPAARLRELADQDRDARVLAQLACTAKRLPTPDAASVAKALVNNSGITGDPFAPLLLWWAVESATTARPATGVEFASDAANPGALYRQTVEKVARRLMAADIKDGPKHVAALLTTWKADPKPVLVGIAQALEGGKRDSAPADLVAALRALPPGDQVAEILARMGDADSLAAVRTRAADAKLPDAARLKAIDLLKQVRDPAAKSLLLDQLAAAKADSFRLGVLAALEAFDDPAVGDAVLKAYPAWPAATKRRAVQLLLARQAWAVALLKAVDAGSFPKTDVTLDHAKLAVGLNDTAVTALVEKHWGKVGAQTAGEKQARITWLNREIQIGGKGDPGKGKALFTKHCAACHQLFGEGGKVGPDLTTADRKNRSYMLTQIVDPSGYIRPEYVVQNVVTADGRKLSGIVTASSTASVTLVNVVNDQSQTTVVSRGDIEDLKPSAISLMPEKLLDTLSYKEIVDLFAYLTAEAPAAKPEIRTPKSGGTNSPVSADAPKKLKVVLLSGSFEYKSDASLEGYKKYLEANFPVECVLVAAKSDKVADFPGIEALDTADVAVFFTRRLQVDGPALATVKKYIESKKPAVGVRTASHGFQKYLEMDAEVLGGDYKGHFGHGVKAEVKPVPAAKDHPILKGVTPFITTGGLYKNANVAKDVTVLLRGTAEKADEPVAWVREANGRRVFYTSLGTPDDFQDKNFVRLLTNGLAWATKSEWAGK